MTNKEMTFKHEQAAKEYRRAMIATGASVSLVAYDSERDLYVFDLIT